MPGSVYPRSPILWPRLSLPAPGCYLVPFSLFVGTGPRHNRLCSGTTSVPSSQLPSTLPQQCLQSMSPAKLLPHCLLLPGLPFIHTAEVRGFNEGYRCEHWLMEVAKVGE